MANPLNILPRPQGPQIPPELMAAANAATPLGSPQEQQQNFDAIPEPVDSALKAAIPQTAQTSLPPELAEAGVDNSAANTPEKGPGLLGKLKNFLTSQKGLLTLGAVGGGLEAAGHPMQTPEGAEMLQHTIEAEKNRELERAKMENVDIPLAKAHSEYFSSFNPTKQSVADTNAASKVEAAKVNHRFIIDPNVGLFDNMAPNGPTLVPGSSPMGALVTPEVARDWNIPAQFVGKQMPMTFFTQLQKSGAAQMSNVYGAEGPARANKVTGAVQSYGIGNPGGGARNDAIVDVLGDNGDVTPMTQKQRLQKGNVLATTALATGKAEDKIFEPALDADTRLKQMYEQATDRTGASDMALLFNHIAMTGGNVKGMRMGSLLTEEHRKARSIPEDLAVLYNHVVAGQTLSPQQRINFVHLAEQVRASKWAQARRQAGLVGVSANEPAPDPDLPAVSNGMDVNPVNMNSGSPATTPPPRSKKQPNSGGGTIEVRDAQGKKIGTATPEQQKRGTYTPLGK